MAGSDDKRKKAFVYGQRRLTSDETKLASPGVALSASQYKWHVFDRHRGGHGIHNARKAPSRPLHSYFVNDRPIWEVFSSPKSSVEAYEKAHGRKSDKKEDVDAYRKKQYDSVAREVKDFVINHGWGRHGKNGQLAEDITQAYLNSESDAQFQNQLQSLGVRNADDQKRWMQTMWDAEDSLYSGNRNVREYDSWFNADEYAAELKKREQQVQQTNGQTANGQTANGQTANGQTANGQTANGQVTNGQQKVPQSGAAQGQAPALTPRNAGPTPQTTAGSMKRPWRVAGQSTNQLDGANVRTGNQPAMAHMDQDAANRSRIAALRSGDQAQIQTAASARTPYEAYQVGQNERERVEQMGKDRRARQAAEREAAAQRRADKRFADRTLYNEADWKNLGRAEGNKADYSDRREGESDKDWAVRDKARQERQGRMDALLKRLDDMGVQDAKKNSFYANDPNKQQNLARLRGLIVGDDGKVRGDITDAQIEGANATLDAWKKGADEKGARQKAFKDMKDAEEISRLRDLYGMGDVSGDKVLAYHNRRMDAERKKILEGMQVAPGLSPQYTSEQNGATTNIKYDDTRPAAMAKFSQDWQKLLDTGFDVREAFEAIQGDKDTWDAYQAGLDTIAADDPDRADKRDQLRRRFIVQQAMKQYGVGKEGGGEQGQAGRQITAQPATPDEIANGLTPPAGAGGSAADLGKAMAQNLPGKSILQPRLVADIENPIQPRQSQQTPGVQVFNSAAGAMQARNAANAAAGLRPRQPQAMLRPGDKREETMAW